MRVLLAFILLFLISCESKVRISERLKKSELKVAQVMVENENIDRALQKVLFERILEKIKNPPTKTKTILAIARKKIKIILVKGEILKEYDIKELVKTYDYVDIILLAKIESAKYEEKRYKTKEEETTYYCVEKTGRGTMLFNLIFTNTSEVFFAKSYKGSFFKRYCDEVRYKPEVLPDKDYMILKALENAVNDFVEDFYSII